MKVFQNAETAIKEFLLLIRLVLLGFFAEFLLFRTTGKVVKGEFVILNKFN